MVKCLDCGALNERRGVRVACPGTVFVCGFCGGELVPLTVGDRLALCRRRTEVWVADHRVCYSGDVRT